MRLVTVTAVTALISSVAFAGDENPTQSAAGQLIGPDGNRWVVEGCAAYPVTSASNTRDKALQMSKWTKQPKPQPKTSKPSLTNQ